MKAGATDYVIKEHMTRLPFAVKEALIQSIFSATPAGIGLVVDRNYIEVNDTFCRMTGYSRNEIIGKSSVMMYPTKEEFNIVGFDKYSQIENKGIGSVETRLKCKDGTIINVISTSTPLDPKDLTKGVTFTVLDITERKKAEEALAESQQLFETLAKTSPVGIFRTDLEGSATCLIIRIGLLLNLVKSQFLIVSVGVMVLWVECYMPCSKDGNQLNGSSLAGPVEF